MKSSVEEINPVQCRLTLDFSPEETAKEYSKVWQNIRKEAFIQGFRKGKAPVEVLKRLYRKHAAHEVLENLVRTHLFEAIDQLQLSPISQPMIDTVEEPKENEPFKISAILDLPPRIELKSYKGFTIKVPPKADVSQRVERELELLRERQATFLSVPEGTAVSDDHQVTLACEAKEEDGTPFPAYTFEEHTARIDKNHLPKEWCEGLIGMKGGEEKLIPTEFREGDKKRTISCQLKVKDIQEVKLPELDDEFAKDVGSDNLADLKMKLTQFHEKRIEDEDRTAIETAYFEVLRAQNPCDVPPAIVDQVIDNMVEEQFGKGKNRAKSKQSQDIREAFREHAKTITKNAYLIDEIIKTERIEVSDEELKDLARKNLIEKDPSLIGKEGSHQDNLLKIKLKNLDTNDRRNAIFNKAINLMLASLNVERDPA